MGFTDILNQYYDIVLYSFIALGVIVFFTLFFISAPYGRHYTEKSQKIYGPAMGGKLGFALQEIPAFAFPLVYFFFFAVKKSVNLTILLFFWEIHYFNRCFTMQMLRKSSPRNLPVGIVFFALGFNTINMFLIWFGLCNHNPDFITDEHFHLWYVILGGIIFILGWMGNIYSDWILINLRKGKDDHSHKIPHGFLYEYISNPNYFCETCEWFGWLLFTRFYGGSISFLVWVVGNLFPRGLAHHQWYKQEFKDKYPANRKAFIPFIL